jgi:hypothetical protein
MALAVAGSLLVSAACDAPLPATCSYTLDGAAVGTFPEGFPSAWSDTGGTLRITLTNRETGVASELLAPNCKRSEARRVIADRLAEDRFQITRGVEITDRTDE